MKITKHFLLENEFISDSKSISDDDPIYQFIQKNKKDDIHKWLWQNKEKVNAYAGREYVYKGGTLLDVFIRFCDENIIKLVLQAGVKYNNSYPPLQVAVRFKKLNVVKLLLNHFGRYIVNIQRESWGNRTALHQAVLGEINEDIIEMLLDNGAKTDIKDDDGFTPLELMESNLEKLKPTDPGYDYYLRLLNLLKGIKTPENKNPEYYI